MNLQTRVINILSKPTQEWPVIASETTDVASLYKEYIMLLAAIPAICGFLGMTLIGVSVPFMGQIRTPMVSGLAGLVVGYALSLAGIFLAAFIVDKLAPSFQSSGGIVQALKMVAFASTPSWVAGVLQLIPLLGSTGVAGSPLRRLPVLSRSALGDENSSRQSHSLHDRLRDRDYCDLRGHGFNLWRLRGWFTVHVLRKFCGNPEVGGLSPVRDPTAKNAKGAKQAVSNLFASTHQFLSMVADSLNVVAS